MERGGSTPPHPPVVPGPRLRRRIVAADNAALEANLEALASSDDVLHLAVSADSEVNRDSAPHTGRLYCEQQLADLQAKRAQWQAARAPYNYKAPRITIPQGEAERQAERPAEVERQRPAFRRRGFQA